MVFLDALRQEKVLNWTFLSPCAVRGATRTDAVGACGDGGRRGKSGDLVVGYAGTAGGARQDADRPPSFRRLQARGPRRVVFLDALRQEKVLNWTFLSPSRCSSRASAPASSAWAMTCCWRTTRARAGSRWKTTPSRWPTRSRRPGIRAAVTPSDTNPFRPGSLPERAAQWRAIVVLTPDFPGRWRKWAGTPSFICKLANRQPVS